MKLQKNKRVKSKKGKGQISFRKLLKLAWGSKYKEPFLDQFKQVEDKKTSTQYDASRK